MVPFTHTLRGLGALLAYPDEQLLAALPSLREWVARDPRLSHERAALMALLSRLDAGDDIDALLDVQEAYVETFDRGRSTSLSLFEHVHGDSRDRGQAMVDLLGMYEKAGLAFATSDLPDHLPAFLEYASMLDETAAMKLLAEVDHILEAIGSALAKRGSPHAAVLASLLRLAGAADPAERIRPETVEDDASFDAIDRAWAEVPVNFGSVGGGALGDAAGMASGCSPQSNQPRTQTVRVVRRAA